MKKLSSQLKKLNKDIKKRINIYKINVASFILWELTQDTPVDTSKAVSNWIVSLHKAHNYHIEAHYVGMGGSTASASAGTAFMLGTTTIQRAKVGEIIYISNNVDYIDLLNQGWSTQAPSGFIEHAVDTAIAKVKRVKI